MELEQLTLLSITVRAKEKFPQLSSQISDQIKECAIFLTRAIRKSPLNRYHVAESHFKLSPQWLFCSAWTVFNLSFLGLMALSIMLNYLLHVPGSCSQSLHLFLSFCLPLRLFGMHTCVHVHQQTTSLLIGSKRHSSCAPICLLQRIWGLRGG